MGRVVFSALVRVIELQLQRYGPHIGAAESPNRVGCTKRRMPLYLGTCAECTWSGAEPEELAVEWRRQGEAEVAGTGGETAGVERQRKKIWK